MAKLSGLVEGMPFQTPSSVLESATLLATSFQSKAQMCLLEPVRDDASNTRKSSAAILGLWGFGSRGRNGHFNFSVLGTVNHEDVHSA